jgi:hypothetical protein
MNAVTSHGAPKITMNSGEAEYRQKLRSAKRAQANPYVNGVYDVFADGPGHAVSDSRTNYGAPTVMPQTIMDGGHSNFEQKDAPSNAPTNIYTKQTGSQELGTSATNNPNQDPELFETNALERRLAMYARAGGNANFGLNNRAAI